ncbi:MAG: PfkB family carbohydrate kinase [Pirellulales bacterium]
MEAPVPQFDVLGFGAVAVDELLLVDEYPAAESKVPVRRRERQCGGLTGTALVAAARLGGRCAYAGVIGDDALSQTVLNRLASEGVELAHAVHCRDARPAHSTIIVDERHRTRTVFAGVEGRLGADPSRPSPAVVQAARCILIDHHGVAGSLRAARLARAAGTPVVADFERRPEGAFDELLAAVDHLVVGRRFARRLTGEGDPNRAAERLAGVGRSVVITCGEEGCWYVDPGPAPAARRQPAFEVAVVDTTGCGDVFHGAYCLAVARGADVDEAVRFAAAAAALKAEHLGGQSGCPTLEQVEALLLRGETR